MSISLSASRSVRSWAKNFARDCALNIPAIRHLRDARNALLTESEDLRLERQDLLARLASANAEHFASSFYHYYACFDPQAVIRRHAVPSLLARDLDRRNRRDLHLQRTPVGGSSLAHFGSHQ